MGTLKTYAPVWGALIATITLLFGGNFYTTYYAKRYIVYQTFFPPSGTIHLHLKNTSNETCTRPANITFGLSQGRITAGKVADTNEPSTAVALRDGKSTAPGVMITTPRLTAAAGYLTLELKYEGGSHNGVELVAPQAIGCDNGVFYLTKDSPGGLSFSGPVLVGLGLIAGAALLLGVVLGFQRLL